MKKRFFTSILLLCLFASCGEDDNAEEQVIKEEQVIEEEDPTENTNPEENENEVCKIVNKDGLIIIEAESFDLKGQWKLVEDEKASQGKYITYNGPNSYQSQNLDNEITVKFTIDAAANYRVRWYMRQPDEAEGDKSNDVWIYLSDNVGHAWVNNTSVTLEHYEKFVSRGKGEFTYGGALDLHNPKSSSWLTAKFPAAGEYTLKICARSKDFQLDKLVFSSGITDDEAKEQSKTLSEAIECN